MVKIVADTLACLPKDFASQNDIPVISQVINFGNESYLEGIDMDMPTFMQKLRTSKELPKTAAPPVELFINAFNHLVPQGEPILCIHPSAEVSGTVRSALTAAAEFPGADIRVIDTRLVGTPLGSLVQLACAWAKEGVDAGTIEQRLLEMSPRCRIYFMVETMEYLARGGRIGGATALMGSLLQIKPILTFTQGRVDQFEKERTHRAALKRLKQLVIDQYPRQGLGYLTVMHADALEEAKLLADDLGKALRLSEVPIGDLPPAVATHGGPGVLGVGFFVE